MQMQRNKPLNMLATFDLPIMTPNCELRRHTTVATQSLWFMNDEQMLHWAEALAEDVWGVEDEEDDWIGKLYTRLFAAEPTASELDLCRAYLKQQTTHFLKDPNPDGQTTLKDHPERARKRALASLGQTLLASNRFLYIE